MAHRAAVADGVVEAAVAGVAGVAAGQRVAQTELLVGDAAAGGAHGPTLQLQHRRRILQDPKKTGQRTGGRQDPVAESNPAPHCWSPPPSGSHLPLSPWARGRGLEQGWGRGFSLQNTRRKLLKLF